MKTKIVLFSSTKGGTGRTTALMNTGYLLSRLGNKVLLVDGDLDSPGLSLLEMFNPAEGAAGRGITGLIKDFFTVSKPYDRLNMAYEIDKFDTKRYIHPVFRSFWSSPLNTYGGESDERIFSVERLKNFTKDSKKYEDIAKLRRALFSNEYWKDKSAYPEEETSGSPEMNAAKQLQSFSSFGEMWFMPAGQGSDEIRDDDLVSRFLFGSEKKIDPLRTNDDREQENRRIKSLRKIFRNLNPLRGDIEESFFDYILVDTRSGYNPFTHHILFPECDFLVVMAHLNQQGVKNTAELVRKWCSGSLKKTGVAFGANSEETENSVELYKRLLFISQILPTGEAALRKEQQEFFSGEIIEPLKKEYGVDNKNWDEIPEVFYRPDLPLKEDIVSLNEEPFNMVTLSYWKLADQILELEEKNLDQIDIYTSDNRKALTYALKNENHGGDAAQYLSELCGLLEKVYHGDFNRFAYNFFQTLQEIEILKAVFLKENLHNLIRIFRLIFDFPHKSSREKTLIADFIHKICDSLNRMAKGVGEGELNRSNENEPFIKLEVIGYRQVGDIEKKSDKVHVATREFRFDTCQATHSELGDEGLISNIVIENIKIGKTYDYYFFGTNKTTAEGWKKLRVIFKEKTGNEVPEGVTEHNTYSREREYDIVFYFRKKTDDHPSDLVIFPNFTGSDEEVIEDIVNGEYTHIAHPYLVPGLFNSLQNLKL